MRAYVGHASGGNLAPSMGGRKKFSRNKMTFLEKIFIFTTKIFDDLLVIDQVFRIFPFFSLIFRIFTMFLLCSYFRAHPTTLLLKIFGGTDAWAVPHLKFLGDRSP